MTLIALVIILGTSPFLVSLMVPALCAFPPFIVGTNLGSRWVLRIWTDVMLSSGTIGLLLSVQHTVRREEAPDLQYKDIIILTSQRIYKVRPWPFLVPKCNQRLHRNQPKKLPSVTWRNPLDGSNASSATGTMPRLQLNRRPPLPQVPPRFPFPPVWCPPPLKVNTANITFIPTREFHNPYILPDYRGIIFNWGKANSIS
jgi:hypothetical protein